MDKRTIGIVATVATALICGCSSICMCIFSVMILAGMPFNTTINGIDQGQAPLPPAIGVVLLCFAVIGIVIPIVVGVITLRKPKAEVVANFNEPVPPAL
jgi:hypothetical protein